MAEQPAFENFFRLKSPNAYGPKSEEKRASNSWRTLARPNAPGREERRDFLWWGEKKKLSSREKKRGSSHRSPQTALLMVTQEKVGKNLQRLELKNHSFSLREKEEVLALEGGIEKPTTVEKEKKETP